MRIVLVLRVAAEVSVVIVLDGVVEPAEKAVPVAVGIAHTIEEALAHVAEVVCRALALGVAVRELVAELQECCFPERFAVGGLCAVVVVLRWREVIAVGLVCGVVAHGIEHLVEVYVVGGKALVVGVGIVGIELHGDVASLVSEFPVILQHCSIGVAGAVAQRGVVAAVYH